MNRLRHLWLFIVGDERKVNPHGHTFECTPANCDISSAEYTAMRRSVLHAAAVDAAMIEVLRTALRPLADMHIEGAPPEYILCSRQDLVFKTAPLMLTMADASRAFYLLDEHNI